MPESEVDCLVLPGLQGERGGEPAVEGAEPQEGAHTGEVPTPYGWHPLPPVTGFLSIKFSCQVFSR